MYDHWSHTILYNIGSGVGINVETKDGDTEKADEQQLKRHLALVQTTGQSPCVKSKHMEPKMMPGDGSVAGGANHDGMEATPAELSRDSEGPGITPSVATKEPSGLTEYSEMTLPCSGLP